MNIDSHSEKPCISVQFVDTYSIHSFPPLSRRSQQIQPFPQSGAGVSLGLTLITAAILPRISQAQASQFNPTHTVPTLPHHHLSPCNYKLFSQIAQLYVHWLRHHFPVVMTVLKPLAWLCVTTKGNLCLTQYFVSTALDGWWYILPNPAEITLYADIVRNSSLKFTPEPWCGIWTQPMLPQYLPYAVFNCFQ